MLRILATAIPRGSRARIRKSCLDISRSAPSSSLSTSTSSFTLRALSSSPYEFDDDDIFARYDAEHEGDEDEDMFGDLDDEAKAKKARRDYRLQQTRMNEKLDARTGRVWGDPYAITEEEWLNPNQEISDLPDWSPSIVSRVSQERVKLYEKGIPTLAELADLPLPPPEPHPAESRRSYVKRRNELHAQHISERVVPIVTPIVNEIVALATSDAKSPALQDKVDEMFESVEDRLINHPDMEILGKNPNFKKWVEQAIEDYLLTVQEGLIEKAILQQKKEGNGSEEGKYASAEDNEDEQVDVPLRVRDMDAEPIFMDCFQEEYPDDMVPPILHPLKPHPKDGTGRMVEEWELAAHTATKRILLRQCTRKVAQILEQEELSRIYIHGREGVGKSATVASIVAMARKSGYIVLYMPDGDRLRKNGHYIQPNPHREGMFDLDILSQEVCGEFLATHESDIKDVIIDKETIEKNFTDKQIKFMERQEDGSISLVDLLKLTLERTRHSPAVYIILTEYLMSQEKKPFLAVMDQFNCYFDFGHYFHQEYDPTTKNSIPLEKVTLFAPFLSAMGIHAKEDDDDLAESVMMKRGGVVVATTEHHAVPRNVTKRLTACAERQSGVHVIEVPRYSRLESDHILANFEATGVGKLRLDRGETIMNKQEVEYLKMASGNIGQHLLDVSIMP